MKTAAKKELIVNVLTAVISLTLLFAAWDQLTDLDKAREQMDEQIFTEKLAHIIAWALPVLQLILAALLSYHPTRLYGLRATLRMLAVLTGYLILGMAGSFKTQPCACMGFLEKGSFMANLRFNTIFILLAMTVLALQKGWLSYINRWLHRLKVRKEVARNSG
ncbi:hypothetical protein SAMN05216436_107125 [bacterium A37T11]|nr:hypothetical protein SAMN05216436_107125 [bacterium A37T11]